jgi:hypothetical protein
MSLTNSVTAIMPGKLNPFLRNPFDRSPMSWERLQTCGSIITQGAVPIWPSAASSDDFILDFVDVTISSPTAGAEAVLYAVTTPVAYFPTCQADVPQHSSFGFGHGLVCGTTTTYTVSVLVSVATCTVNFVSTGWRKV